MNDACSLVVAVNDGRVLERNLLRSPDLAGTPAAHELILRAGYPSAASAYNSGLAVARHDTVVFVHQDVYLPQGWLGRLSSAIRDLDDQHIAWGVLGSFGVTAKVKTGLGQVYSTGWGLQGQAIDRPTQVDTLDELVLVVRKSSGLHFDPALPHFHLYGADICLQARQRGLACYALPAFCVHNTNQLITLPREFETAYHYLKRKWRRHLPVTTSCTVIDRFDLDLRRRSIESLVVRLLGRPAKVPARRVVDPTSVLQGTSVIRGTP